MARPRHKLSSSPAPLKSLVYLCGLLVFAQSAACKSASAAHPLMSAQLNLVPHENRTSPSTPGVKQLAPPPPPPPPPPHLLNKLVKLDSNGSRSLASYKQSQLAHVFGDHHQLRRPETPRRRVGLFDRVCTGTSNRMQCSHNKTEHYLSILERYKNCTYVIGNLELTCIERNADLSFLNSIREITGHLLIAHVELEHMSMLNLQIIRGSDLFTLPDQSGEFAMILVQNRLKTLQLPNLREILAGSVGSYNNSNLCYLSNKIIWEEILNPKYGSVFVYEGQVPECPACDSNCPGGCWAEGAHMCQKLSKIHCDTQCANRCFGPSESDCCDHSCAGGCFGPRRDQCLACKDFYDDGRCISECPAQKIYNPIKFQWELNPNGKYAFGAACVKDCPENLMRDSGACVRTCPTNKRPVKGECQPCNGTCPDNETIEVVQSVNTDQPVNCTGLKYIRNGTCLDCAKGCKGGCTGPLSHLGDDGCYECAKSLVNTTGDSFMVQCLHPEEPCPDGFYQEYVPTHQDGPLKLFSGKSICRRCHHRCKTCTSMGTHVSVCECASYVAGEQCEDSCPRDHFADNQSRKCIHCSPECNGCTGPTEADCVSCRIYRVYYEIPTTSNLSGQLPVPAQLLSATATSPQQAVQVRFNCTAQCPTDKPHRISESNMLDPYCSEDPGTDPESQRATTSSSTSILFILIISSSIMVCISLYRCQMEKDKTVKLTMHLSGIDDVEPLTPSNLKPNLAPLRSIKETELRKGNVLGSGFGGTVYQGFWFPEGKLGKIDGKSSAIPVAIKVLRDNGQTNVNKEFLDEAYTMASVNHPNLVRLLAVCITPNHLMLVTQLMPLGCLLEYVKKYENDIGSKNLLEWCKQIARGMSYLEDRRMVHRDLALRNVLLQTSGKALISDFGLAKFLDVDQNEYHSGGGRLPIKWLAPECIRERKFTHKSDVWAFGVTIWELLTFGKRPFDNCDTKDLLSYIESGKRLEQPAYMSTEVYLVMFSCWFFKPDDRPNFRQLVQDFVRFARDPQRYLICNIKGIDYCNGKLKDLDEDVADYTADEYESDLASDDQDCTDDFDLSPPTTATTTIMPNSTPTTHNRLNEVFGFGLRRSICGEHGHDERPVVLNASEAEQEHHHNHHRLMQQHQARSQNLQRIISDEQDERYCKVEDEAETGAYVNASYQCKLMMDINNNNVNGAWATSNSGHNLSNEQPTDTYDYLMPSPCTDTDLSQFSPFSNGQQTANFRMQNPPQSTGLLESAINNEEYFLNRPNYVNQHLFMQSDNELNKQAAVEAELKKADIRHHRSPRKSKRQSKGGKSKHPISRSSSNIPHSLV